MVRIPILMYHNVCLHESQSQALTISMSKLESQLQYLKKENYITVFASEIENCTLSLKNICITFDDVTENQFFLALSLLEKYNCKATFYIPFSYIGAYDFWNKSDNYTLQKIMSIEQIKSLNPKFIELGYHSFAHKKYSNLTDVEIQEDFEKSNEVITRHELKVMPTLAFPYGNFPKDKNRKAIFNKILEQNNIKLAFRIGNRLASLPLKNKYEINRLDIKGNQGMTLFKLKLRFGKLFLF